MGVFQALSLVMKRRAVKSLLRKSAARFVHGSQLYKQRFRNTLMILAYHRVLSEKELRRRYVQPGMYVLDHVFEDHVKSLAEHFQIVSFGEALKLLNGEEWDEGSRYCVVTFDDGWLDNYQYAYPILKRYGVPATIFLATEFIGGKAWFWPERLLFLLERTYSDATRRSERQAVASAMRRYLPGAFGADGARGPLRGLDLEDTLEPLVEACKKLEQPSIDELICDLCETLQVAVPDERVLLNWDEVARMSEGGIEFGSHSCTHRILTTLSMEEIRRELTKSKARLSGSVRTFVPVFCYPNGDYDRAIQDAVRESGYEAAVSTRPGLEGRSPGDRLGLRRVSVHNDVASTVPQFSLHLLRRTR